MTRNSLPRIQTRLDAISVPPNVPQSSHKKGASSSDSSNRGSPSFDVNNGRNDQPAGQYSRIFSLAGSAFGFETPQATTPEMTSPDTSMIAVHGSALGSPFSPGMGGRKHGRRPFSDCGSGVVTQRKEVDIADTASTTPTDIIPVHNAEVEMSEAFNGLFPVHNDRIIAIDFDDVCTQNMLAMITEHNAEYGTDLALRCSQSQDP